MTASLYQRGLLMFLEGSDEVKKLHASEFGLGYESAKPRWTVKGPTMGATALSSRPIEGTAPPRPGAEFCDAGVRYGVWAPHASRVTVVIQARAGGGEARLDLATPTAEFFEGTDPAGADRDASFLSLDSNALLPYPPSPLQPD